MTSRATALISTNGTGAAPYAATRERYLPQGIPMKGILSVSVPGLVNSWLDAHERYGSLSLSEVFGPALDLADNGFPVTHYLSRAIAADRPGVLASASAMTALAWALLQAVSTPPPLSPAGNPPADPAQILDILMP